jgi:hypothetical protein
LNSARQKSRDSKRVADIKQIQTALELYFADENEYPDDEGASLVLGAGSAVSLCDKTTGGWSASCGSGTTYMGLVPAAPTPAETGCSTEQNSYTYIANTPFSDYSIAFCLGGKVGDLDAGTATADPNGITQ